MSRRMLILVLAVFVTTPAQNLLPNPSFETWLDTVGVHLPLGWVTSEITHPGSAVRSEVAHTGSYALELFSPDTVAYATTTTLISAGANYEFTGYAYTGAVLGGSFIISWLGILGNPIGTPTLIPVYRATSYREYSRRVTAPDSALFCVVGFGSAPGATVTIDDITLEPSTAGIRGRLMPTIRSFTLYPAQPNPFYDVTAINYSLSVGAAVSLRVYDLVGNEVKTLTDEYRPAGFYTALWNGTDNNRESLAPGIYFCRLEVGNQTLTQKIIRLGW